MDVRSETGGAPRLSEIVSALSFALDLTEGRPMGHSARSCILGLRIAAEAGLGEGLTHDLYYALLLKDAGCSSNASRLHSILRADEIRAKGNVKFTDWTRIGWDSAKFALGHIGTGRGWRERVWLLARSAVKNESDSRLLVEIRCERGAAIARRVGFSPRTAEAIYSLDEHWNGKGHPEGRRGENIPLLSRILSLAQTLEVFHARDGAEAAMGVARRRSGRWFDPALVKAAVSLHRRGALWGELEGDPLAPAVAMEPGEAPRVSAATLDGICEGFADIIDAKSPFTYRHSHGVATAAATIAAQMGLGASGVRLLRRAGLLHDIGKLAVPNSILEKPGKLTAEEWATMRLHPHYTFEVLRRVPVLATMSDVAAAHHERLDGKGYHRGLTGEQLGREARILAVADVFDALAAHRPYRAGMPLEKVFAILRSETPGGLDTEAVEALYEASRDSASLLRLAEAVERSGETVGPAAGGTAEAMRGGPRRRG